ncbi:MAG: hypothetical protein FWG90_08035 [Oscillospiraceae bacterium]|nr:hypothetical protein [Oscillospiraceae bacterium]
MSAKEQLLSMLNFIEENEAERILIYIRRAYALKPKTWDDIEEDDPLPDEVAAFEKYRSGANS